MPRLQPWSCGRGSARCIPTRTAGLATIVLLSTARVRLIARSILRLRRLLCPLVQISIVRYTDLARPLLSNVPVGVSYKIDNTNEASDVVKTLHKTKLGECRRISLLKSQLSVSV